MQNISTHNSVTFPLILVFFIAADSNSTGTIVMSVVVGLVGLILVILVVVLLCYCKRLVTDKVDIFDIHFLTLFLYFSPDGQGLMQNLGKV